MKTFALISEGVTDQIVLARLIHEICGEMFEDGVDVNPLQPLRDSTDAASAPHGGWELVLEFCEERAADALATNDYVVIHLDTDQANHINFGVELFDHTGDRSYDVLIFDVIAMLKNKLGAALCLEYAGRMLFAISVHSMESWLLLCLFDRDETRNSLIRLNHQLKISDEVKLTKEVKSYKLIAKRIKRKKLRSLAKNNSLGHFLAQLSALTT